jgi:hypothetical protein
MRRTLLAFLSLALLAVALPSVAAGQVRGVPTTPIPQDPLGGAVPQFLGSPAVPDPAAGQNVPQHPFMAPNGLSNIHNDAYQSDAYDWLGPLGVGTRASSAHFDRECASITFDSAGRLVTICVGLDRPVLALLDPETLAVLAALNLPRRTLSTGALTDFSAGGYFYLDDRDRAILPTANRRIYVVRESTGLLGSLSFKIERSYDVRSAMPKGDAIISVLPDWDGRIWFATREGHVGTVSPATGAVRSVATGEPIGNSFAVDETGGVFIVTDAALYRFEANALGTPTVSWRQAYANVGVVKPGQTQAGSGTTPTLMGQRYVAITDNADPMNILVFERGEDFAGDRLVCTEPIFQPGASATDQSLIATDRSLVAENNYGYSGITATMNGGVTSPGLTRVDLDEDGSGCHTVWESDERAPSAVPKLSLGGGLLYTYTKPPRDDDVDAWYLTALDFDTGETVYKRLGGTGFGFNNHYAPVTLAPDGTAYVGAFGGLARFEDTP